jgi:replicative superfamily II helicase
MDRLWNEAKKETEEDRKFIKEHSIMSYNDLLVQKPWDKLNDELYGKHNSSLLIFHDTFIPMLKGTPSEELFNNSETQKELSKFIEENLSDSIYKRTKQSEEYVQNEVYKT